MGKITVIAIFSLVSAFYLSSCGSVPKSASADSDEMSPNPRFSHSDSYVLDPVDQSEPSRNERFILERQ
jgi:hypothetical protein